MRVLWPHNFDESEENAGVFMHTAAEAMRDHGVELVLLPLGNLRSPMEWRRASQRVRAAADDVDVVHAQFGSACGFVSAKVPDRPKVLSIRGSDWVPAFSRGLKWQLHARLAVGLTRMSIRSYDVVIPVSDRLADDVVASGYRGAIVVAPDPIDLEKFVPRDKRAVRSELGLPEDAALVLFTSVVSDRPLKRRELALAAVEWARRKVPNLELLAATGYPHAQMPKVVAAADVAICASVAEGWPNAIKEALACNVPFVATDVSDLRVIADAEPSCRVVAATPEALGEALVQVLSGPQPKGLRRHLTGMTMDEYARRTVEAYEVARTRKG